jgi:electron transfer flavoprotein beta subunit
MIVLVLVHEGLDVSADLELAEPGAGRSGVRHRGGDRLVVTAPADRAAVEWASALTSDVVALTVSPPAADGTLDWAAGRGVARAVWIWDEGLEALDLAAMARVVAAAVRRIGPDLVLAGARGLSGATGALPALVGAHLGWPCVDGAIRVTGSAVERRLPGGRREELVLSPPAIVTVTADSIEPRYVSVGARRAAARRGHEVWSLADLGLTPDAVRKMVRLRVDRVDWPRPRPRRTAKPAAPAGPRSAADRLRQLVGGGAAGGAGARSAPAEPAAAAGSRLVEGDPRAVADRILAFLEQHGLA